MFCNCNFHFFRGSYYIVYTGLEEGSVLKYCSFNEYDFVEKTRMRWRIMVENRRIAE